MVLYMLRPGGGTVSSDGNDCHNHLWHIDAIKVPVSGAKSPFSSRLNKPILPFYLRSPSKVERNPLSKEPLTNKRWPCRLHPFMHHTFSSHLSCHRKKGLHKTISLSMGSCDSHSMQSLSTKRLEIWINTHHPSESKRETGASKRAGGPLKPAAIQDWLLHSVRMPGNCAVSNASRVTKKKSKYPLSLLLSKCCSQHFKDFQNYLKRIVWGHPLLLLLFCPSCRYHFTIH